MATRTVTTPASRFHSLPDAILADLIGKADALAKAAEAELSALKTEAKSRAVLMLIGDHHEVTVTEQIAGRADIPALKLHLGSDYARFEKPVISTVVRIKAVERASLVERSGNVTAMRARRDEAKFRAWHDAPAA